MNWKEFLKPDWRKIMIFLFCYLIIPWPFFLDFIPCQGKACIAAVEPPRGPLYISIIILIYTFDTRAITSQIYLLFVYSIASYVFSCIIVWLYDEVKRKKK